MESRVSLQVNKEGRRVRVMRCERDSTSLCWLWRCWKGAKGRQPLEAAKSKEAFSPLEHPERNAALPAPRAESMANFWSPALSDNELGLAVVILYYSNGRPIHPNTLSLRRTWGSWGEARAEHLLVWHPPGVLTQILGSQPCTRPSAQAKWHLQGFLFLLLSLILGISFFLVSQCPQSCPCLEHHSCCLRQMWIIPHRVPASSSYLFPQQPRGT